MMYIAAYLPLIHSVSHALSIVESVSKWTNFAIVTSTVLLKVYTIPIDLDKSARRSVLTKR